MADKITKGMTLGDIISKYPETMEIMMKYGLHCIGCHVAAWESLEQGAKAHGMSDKNIESMLKEMNEMVKDIRGEDKE
jgi:hybrid cluster-associated redox disulfide protein